MVTPGMIPELNDNMTLDTDYSEGSLMNSNDHKPLPTSPHKTTLDKIK